MQLGECKVRRMKLSELTPAQYNPRKISEKAMEGLGNSIDRFGIVVPIVWNERSGNIVGGHQRFKYLQASGEKTTDVVVVDLDHREEIALNVALNSPRLRGRFTKEVVGMLKRASDGIGDVFSSLNLDDLQKYVNRLNFDDDDEGPGSGSSSSLPDSPPDGGAPDADVVVTCPKCKSKWEMATGKVIKNEVEDQKEESV